MISRPRPEAMAVYATRFPIVPALRAIAPIRKFTPAPTNLPKEVANEKAVARTEVSYCSGSQRLNKAKLPPKNPTNNRQTINGLSPLVRQKPQPNVREMKRHIPAK